MKGIRSAEPAYDLMEANKAIGRQLMAIRKEKGLNQSDIGRLLGISFQQVQKYENGTNRLSAASLLGLSKMLKVPVSKFFP